ncbi:sulfite exporter TauE/SafE family protein [Desertivirga xinjiangensis]|uniref:sulfite exporter TauE/SafE family protein n=1 Tax=Desertivirga xinjiangensis TaxID=539206 RepID=UPI00210BB580|nr:sulfite exporter TauE/SafE family protein [Pedobacter xinjiangensis]
MDYTLLLTLSLFVIGFLYASVGHGGASGYLAVLSIFSVPIASYKPLILVLNILVAGMGFIQFSRAGFLKWKLCWPFLITSIPMAFLGSKMPLHGQLYNLLLGLALMIPVIRLLGFSPVEKMARKELTLPLALLLGMIIGFLSGMLNIGGGIFLSPILILLAWGNAKEAAAASAIFIVLNSASGLLGHPGDISINAESLTWFSAALCGGLAGAYWGSQRFQLVTVRYVLTAVLAVASVKLIFFM